MIRLRYGIRQKMLLIVGLSCLTLAGFGWYMLGQEQKLVRSERVLMLSNITDSAVTLADKISTDIQAGRISRDAGITQLRDLLQTIRFGAAKDYVLAYTMEGITVANAGNPALDGKDMSRLTGPDGRMPVGEMLALTRTNGTGVVEYLWPRPKDSNIPGPVMKLAYVRAYQPLNLMLGAAVYMDDINVELNQLATEVITALAIVGAISLAITLVIASSILRPLATLGAQMQSLADGNAEIEISQTDRRDEIGVMAGSVAIFRTNALRVRSLAAEQEQLTIHAQAERRQAMLALANDFDQRINTLVEKVATAADNMQRAATSLSTTAEQTSMQSRTVA